MSKKQDSGIGDSGAGMSFADEIEAAKIEAGKKFIKGAAYVIFGATVIFLGVFNYMLYARAFDDQTAKLLAILPAVTISGSVLLLTFANIRWFSIGTQAQVGKFAGYGLFAIEAANAVTEWTLVNGWLDASSPIIRIYAQFGIPLALVLIALVYKLLIDSDEESEIVRDHNLTAAMIRKRKRAAQLAYLDDATITARITRAGQDAARRLTAAHTVGADDDQPDLAQLPAASFSKDAEAVEDGGEGEAPKRPLA
jgi:hypothetical protein